MKRIAITGGIGSGKSYICKSLENRGIHVYDCDLAAKRLIHSSEIIIRTLKELVGDNVYNSEGHLNKDVLARYILASTNQKQAVNDIVHPIVAQDFLQSGCNWLESAILFDSGFEKRVDFDKIICVTAPLEVRLERIMKRDNISKDMALQWIQTQLSQEEIRQRSNFEIVNDGHEDIEKQITNIIHIINT